MQLSQGSIQLTVARNPGGKFDHWEGSAGGQNCMPSACAVTVQHGNSGQVSIAISDPHGPASGPQQVTFSSNPVSLPATPKAEIHDISPGGTTSLSFKDHNWDSGTIKYTLNFNNAPAIDPIIQNTGGGPSTQQDFLPTTIGGFATDLAIAFLLGIVVALIVRRLASR
jgi:hypothetical protein